MNVRLSRRHPASQGHHPDRFLTICYLPINLATILWMVVSPRPPPSRLRIMAGFSLFSIVVLIATLVRGDLKNACLCCRLQARAPDS